MKKSLLLLPLALAGCTVGPNYGSPPKVADISSFHRADSATTTSAPPPAKWWLTLNDTELNTLEDAALTNSPTLAAAEARLRQSRVQLATSRANGLPNTGLTAAYVHANGLGQALSGLSGGAAASGASSSAGSSAAASSSSSDINLYNVSFDATWEVDLFGANRRANEAARAGAEAADAQVADAQVSLTAEVAQAYVQLRDLQQRLALAKENVTVEQKMLDMTNTRRQGGTASDLDVERLTTQLETTRADIVPLNAQVSEQLDRLALLTGRTPGALDAELAASAPVPLPPASVAIGDPTTLLQRRPDIRTAERKLAQATATIGQREAAQFPKLTLIGTIGYGSTKLSNLFDSGNRTALEAPLLQWTPFDFGRNRAAINQAQAARDEAEANYRQAVLSALQDAETSLSRFGSQRSALVDQLRVQASASRAAQLTQVKMQGGTATTIDTLDAERNRIQAQSSVTEANAQLTQDFISLQKSLGLGWQSPG